MYELHHLPGKMQSEIRKRMENDFVPFYYENGEPAISKFEKEDKGPIGYSKKDGQIYKNLDAFYLLAHYGYMTKEEQDSRRNKMSTDQEKFRFEKAEKIKYSEYKGEQFFDGDEYFPDIETFFDGLVELHGFQYEKYPKYVWATKPEPYINKKDVYNIYQPDVDDLSGEYDWPVEGKEDLQKALDEFVECNKNNVAYYCDYSTALLIDEELTEFIKRIEG